MRYLKTAILAGSALALLTTPARAESVEEVIARHIEARGGKAAWDGIRSLKVTGTFQAFSLIEPFTLHRKRQNKFHIDHMQNEKRVVIGYDGSKAWWDNEWFGSGPQPMSGPDLAVVLREADFVTPLFDYKDRGYSARLLGNIDLEGVPTLGVEITRDDDSKEIWYLDPKTYLEVGRDSPGSDFGRPMTQRTFYDDFRKVGKVVIPHFSETQWYTRDRVMTIESIEVNPEVDDELFLKPAPPGMGPLQAMEGSWKVAVQRRGQPNAPFQDIERESSIELLFDGGMVQEKFNAGQAGDVIRTISYDNVKKCYRVTQINARDKQMDIHEGQLGEDGKLILSNLETGTPGEFFGTKYYQRVSIFEVTDDGFKVEQEISVDGGENWFVASKSTYSRSDGES